MDFSVKKGKVLHVEKQKDRCSYCMGGMELIEKEIERFRGMDFTRYKVFPAM